MLIRLLHDRSLDTLHHSDHEDGSQERRQRGLQVEPPLSPWSSMAYPDEMLSDYVEGFALNRLDGTSDDGREPSVSVEDNEYDEIDTIEFGIWKDDTIQDDGLLVRDAALESSNLATGPMDSQKLQGRVHLEASYIVPRSSNTSAESLPATVKPIESVEELREYSRPGRPVDLGISMKSGFQPPSIIVSQNANDEVAEGDQCDLSVSCRKYNFYTGQVDMHEIAAQHSYKPTPPLQPGARPEDLVSYSPNNYEMATQDRQPPDIPDGIDPQSAKIAEDSLDAFCADADLTAADAAADTGSSRVKRRQLSRKHPLSQTPTQTSSAFHDSLQVPCYPTPPMSSRGLPTYSRLENTYTGDSPLPTQATPFRNNALEPPSPVSPSPSSLPEVADGITRCPICPHTAFRGTPQNQKNSLQRHKRDFHNGMPPLECLVSGCYTTFAPGRKDNRERHVRAKHPGYLLTAPSKGKKRRRDSDSTLD